MGAPKYHTYLKTLRRVPDDIVLAVGSRDINTGDPNSCLCGWFLREQVARMAMIAADQLDVHEPEVTERVIASGTPERCAAVFGGSEQEWEGVFTGVLHPRSGVEDAFVERVLECVA